MTFAGKSVFVIICILLFIAGVIFDEIVNIKKDTPKKSINGGYLLIRKNEEAIDGQIRFTKDLWTLCTYKEVTFKVKNIPGEPGDWEDKNGN